MARKPDDILDELLVLSAQSGDQKAMTSLVKRYHSMLISYAYRTTQNGEAAQDSVQEAWKVVLGKLQALHDPAHFKTWIYRIVHNKAVDWVRKQTKERVQNEVFQSAEAEESESDDKIEKMADALRRLDPVKRQLIEMYYRDNLSVHDISIILKIPEGTVKSRLYSARSTLKDMMAN